ncbi:hypothetical protein [Vibrio coralliilyticus]|uniref:hypothetical protein n=1 Tax=Vibrio coralliilyticus TaxID=190893 RepID=UPI001E2DCF89|nr:hypothetical protein [Vibrio coralliilyticus]MCC2524123.1 hypothetical protein [Vibrio coralliilyticus]
MKKILFGTLLCVSLGAHAASDVWTSAKIDMVFAGYPDESVSFLPIEGAKNPANCNEPTAYAIPAPYDSKAALSVLLAAKMADKPVYFSVRGDICHTIQQTDAKGITVPVIQRIAVK